MTRRTALVLVVILAGFALPAQALAASPDGSAGQMPAFYDGQQFTINFKEEPSGGEAALLAHNRSINTIYMSDQAEAAGVMFTSVLDAIQGDGFNPLWQEVQIVFKTIPPKQFLSDNEIAAAAAAGRFSSFQQPRCTAAQSSVRDNGVTVLTGLLRRYQRSGRCT